MPSDFLNLEWPRLHNARDLGGLATPAGATAVQHYVRSDNLFDLTAAGAKCVLDYGVRTVIDLRHAEERRQQPGYFEIHPDPAIKFVAISMNADPGEPGYEGMFRPGALLLWNRRTLLLGSPYIAQTMRAISAAPPGGVLFHCYSGKDRTGIVAQLLLLLAGVDEDTVYADYMLTNERLAARNAEVLAAIADPVERAFVATLCFVQRENIEHNLAFYRAAGGAEGYLHSIGLSHGEIAQLRARWTA
jgi:protein-tyrosine phosphatase